jgi:hypothetical protein
MPVCRLPRQPFGAQRTAEFDHPAEGYYVTVTFPNTEPERITETFKTEAEAWRWIKNDSVVWLSNHQRQAPSLPSSSSHSKLV